MPINQRFLSGPALRLDQRTEGSGIGLAIVRDVVDAYGGELSFSGADGGGLAVQLRLPAAAL